MRAWKTQRRTSVRLTARVRFIIFNHGRCLRYRFCHNPDIWGLDQIHKSVWIRHVLIPGWTDDETSRCQLSAFVHPLHNAERVEDLLYHALDAYKYEPPIYRSLFPVFGLLRQCRSSGPKEILRCNPV